MSSLKDSEHLEAFAKTISLFLIVSSKHVILISLQYYCISKSPLDRPNKLSLKSQSVFQEMLMGHFTLLAMEEIINCTL